MSRTCEEFEQWRAGIEADGLVVSPEGRLRFSATRREDLRILFGLAGIDIATIRTMKQYVRARDASRAFFAQRLTHLARRGRMTPQRRLLIGITEGDVEGTRRLRQALGAKDALRGAREPDDG